jgi:hypothetical protein
MQGRFVRFTPKETWTTLVGVVIQDEGDTPKVQIQLPDLNDTAANEFKFMKSEINCPIVILVDGVPRILGEGSGQDDDVSISRFGDHVNVHYLESGLKMKIGVGLMPTGCYLAAYVSVPDVDRLVGVMGTPDGESRT